MLWIDVRNRQDRSGAVVDGDVQNVVVALDRIFRVPDLRRDVRLLMLSQSVAGQGFYELVVGRFDPVGAFREDV